MSSSPRPIPKSNDEHSPNQVAPVFPPLMTTLDVYMDASSDIRYNQVVEKVAKGGKKKSSKKTGKKKVPVSNVQMMEPLPAEIFVRPESRIPSSHENQRDPQPHRHLYSLHDREDFSYDSEGLSLDSISKRSTTNSAQQKVPPMSSPPLTDRRQNKSSYSPRSPARMIVQPAPGSSYGNSKNPIYMNSPSEVSKYIRLSVSLYWLSMYYIYTYSTYLMF